MLQSYGTDEPFLVYVQIFQILSIPAHRSTDNIPRKHLKVHRNAGRVGENGRKRHPWRTGTRHDTYTRRTV